MDAMTIDRSTPALGSLFQELILDHYKRPRNKGELERPDVSVHMRNPSCGDGSGPVLVDGSTSVAARPGPAAGTTAKP